MDCILAKVRAESQRRSFIVCLLVDVGKQNSVRTEVISEHNTGDGEPSPRAVIDVVA